MIGITYSYSVAIVSFRLTFLQRHRNPPSEESRASIRQQLSYLAKYLPCQVIQFLLPFNHSAVKPVASLRRDNFLRCVMSLILHISALPFSISLLSKCAYHKGTISVMETLVVPAGFVNLVWSTSLSRPSFEDFPSLIGLRRRNTRRVKEPEGRE